MRIAVTGSIATDHLMRFPGSFTEHLLAEHLDRVSLSFLADDLEIRRGGVAANICYGLGLLGLTPVLVGAVGADFADYEVWLKRHGVDTSGVRVSDSRHTARFVCTTDRAGNQIATFYSGAMQEAHAIELAGIARSAGEFGLVLVGPNDPEAMLRHTAECRTSRYPFLADPSQQLALADGEMIRTLVDGALGLFTNEYERELLEQKTGWSSEQVLDRVGMWVTTLGPQGAVVERRGRPAVRVPAVPPRRQADPTGAGDAFRAGFIAGMAWELGDLRSAQLGCALATLALEAVGPQDYSFDAAEFLKIFAANYGEEAAAEVARHVPARPVPDGEAYSKP